MRIADTDGAESILARAHAVSLVLFLAERSEILAFQLRDVHSNYMNMFALAQDLAEAGVIEIKEQRSPRVTYTFKLTPKGRKVAEKLREAKELIGE
jgi:DNA-binding MarR family transcriptional regulator